MSAHWRIAFHINPRNFVPQPKVWASVVHLTTRSRNPDQWPIGNHVHTDDVETVCRELFWLQENHAAQQFEEPRLGRA